ncbi:MAG: hypothetical protein K6B70_01715 [Clostridia bacterium]|nr:hypothetical protein [Clostridia bacterium]
MIYDFNVNDTKFRYRRNFLLFQYKPRTTQEVVNAMNDSQVHRYGSRIKIDNENVKIITDALESSSEFGITSVDFKVSEIKEIDFKSYFAESKIFVVSITILIIAVTVLLVFWLGNLKALYILVFLINLFYFVLSNTIELMKITIKNKEEIYIPIRKITEFNKDNLVETFIGEIKNKNPNTSINVNQHRKFSNKSIIYKIVLCTCVIMYVLLLLVGMVITYIK